MANDRPSPETGPQPTPRGFLAFLAAIWRHVLWTIRILLATRASVLSVLAGLVLFYGVGQAHDLFADTSFGALPEQLGGWLHWALFFIYVFVVWAFAAHMGARLTLENRRWIVPWQLRGASSAERDAAAQQLRDEISREYAGEIRWIPRILGVLPFAAVAIGLYKADEIVTHTITFKTSAAAHRQILTLYGLDFLAFCLFVWFLFKRREIVSRIERFAGRRGASLSNALVVFSLIASTLLFVGAYICPFLPGITAPRAVLVPFLFGSLVLFASFLVHLGSLAGLPLLEVVIAIAILLTGWNTTFNNLRIVEPQPSKIESRQIDIDKAVEKWRAANGCESGKNCPTALIVAAEGGASRAAFATATALGYLFDRAGELGDGAQVAVSPARRLFAISGVSGGAYGAAAIRAALQEAQSRNDGAPPCLNAPSDWFAPQAQDVRTSWRACLQALVAGDYLSPAFVGVAFRDNLAPSFMRLRDDRAALVERAWEYHFDAVTTPEGELDRLKPIKDDLPFGAPGATTASGLRRPFGYISSEADGTWTPLLLLNGTSVNTGARLIASDLVSTAKTREGTSREPLYPAAYDLFELLSTPCTKVERDACVEAQSGGEDHPQVRDGADVRLSTAAMLSARFPVVSPAGTIRSHANSETGDRVVDGGYFENAGLTTALDIARALHQRGITPVVLWVQNDPASGEGDPRDGVETTFPPRAASSLRVGAADAKGLEQFFGTIVTPFNALAATRAGHSLEVAAVAQRALEEMNGPPQQAGGNAITSNYYTFKLYRLPRFDRADSDSTVRPDPSLDEYCKPLTGVEEKNRPRMTEVSMSWWLSQTVQAQLDSQVCDWRNRRSLGDLISRLSQRPPAR